MNEKLIHVKISRNDLIEDKKRVLEIEMNILKILQSIKNYKELRLKELRTKTRLLRKMREFKTSLNKLDRSLPKSKVPKKKREKALKDIESSKDSTLDSELESIQRELKQLEQQV